MKADILKLKLELKNLAKTIKSQKRKRGAQNNGYIPELDHFRKLYRHKHVLYCLARGRSLDQCDSGNGLNMEYIEFSLEALKEDKKLYVVVDEKLPVSVQAVQASHAVAEFMKKHPATLWKNGTLVLLKSDLKYAGFWRYKHLPYEFAEFKESDLNNQITAFAVFGPADDFMKKQQLL